MRTITAVIIAVALATASAPAAYAAPRACTRILVEDEYGRDVTPCPRARLMTADDIIALVWRALGR